MAGSKLYVNFDDTQLRFALHQVERLADDFSPMLKRIGVGLVEVTQRRFETATDPSGQAWHPLSKRYAKRKKGPGILREKAMRGGLMGSITYQIEGNRSLAVGSNKEYAAIHQFGGTIQHGARSIKNFRKMKANGEFAHSGRFVKQRHANFSSEHHVGAHSERMPARPYLGWGWADQNATLDAVTFTYQRLLSGRT
jgi:phage virion morphogenesis protein